MPREELATGSWCCRAETARDRGDLRVRARGRRRADGDAAVAEKRARLERLRAALDAPPGDARWSSRSPTPVQRYAIPADALPASSTAACKTSTDAVCDLRRSRATAGSVAGAVGVACVPVYGSDDVERAETLGVALQLINIMRDVPRTGSSAASTCHRTSWRAFGVSEDDIAAAVSPRLAGADGVPGRAGARAPRARACSCSTRSTAAARSASDVRRPLPRTLDRIEAHGFDVFDRASRALDPASSPRRRAGSSMKVAVVGGGLAGLAAALELVDAGAEVTLLRGAADARRRRADPSANATATRAAARQRPAHRARLLHRGPAFLDRIGERRRSAAAARAAGDRRGGPRVHDQRRPRLAAPLPPPAAPRAALAPAPARPHARAQAEPGESSATCSGASASPSGRSTASGTSSCGLRSISAATRPSAERGPLHRPHRAARPARESTSCCRWSRSARCTARPPAARSLRAPRATVRPRARRVLADGERVAADRSSSRSRRPSVRVFCARPPRDWKTLRL